MNTDFRLSLGFRRHRKTRRLKRELGHEGVLCLIWLFGYAAEHRPDGILTGLSNADIEEEVEWDGEKDAFTGALYEIGWLDIPDAEDPGGTYNFVIHEWEKWNPWAAGAEARSVRARVNANKRWHPDGMQPASNQDAPLLSSPSPAPTQKKKASRKRKPVRPDYDESFNSLWEIRKSDPGPTSSGSKVEAWEEWGKLDDQDKNDCGLALQKIVGRRIEQDRINKKVGKRDAQYQEIESLPHLSKWIRDRRWE